MRFRLRIFFYVCHHLELFIYVPVSANWSRRFCLLSTLLYFWKSPAIFQLVGAKDSTGTYITRSILRAKELLPHSLSLVRTLVSFLVTETLLRHYFCFISLVSCEKIITVWSFVNTRLFRVAKKSTCICACISRMRLWKWLAITFLPPPFVTILSAFPQITFQGYFCFYNIRITTIDTFYDCCFSEPSSKRTTAIGCTYIGHLAKLCSS